MSLASYATKNDMEILKEALESRLYTVKSELIGKIDTSEDRMGARLDMAMRAYEQRTNIHMNTAVSAAEERIMARMTACIGAFEQRILAEIRNGKEPSNPNY